MINLIAVKKNNPTPPKAAYVSHCRAWSVDLVSPLEVMYLINPKAKKIKTNAHPIPINTLTANPKISLNVLYLEPNGSVKVFATA